MSFSYANPGSGPSAGGIGWFNFGNLTIAPGDVLVGLTGTLNNGYTVTFDIQSVPASIRNFIASPTPTFGGSAFGNIGYTGILGNVALYTDTPGIAGPSTLVLTNIVVEDTGGNPVTNYTAVVADAEQTGINESWTWGTNGGVWNQLAALGGSLPLLVGLGTNTATMTGNATVNGAYVLTTQSPTSLILSTDTLTTLGREAVAIGFATTTITLEKNIGQRIDSADQFVLNIAGVPNDQATTAGFNNGIQTQFATIDAIPGNVYTINEAMAPGSVSTLGDYIITTSAMNATPNGSIPPVGALPINVTPQLGDDITYLIVNAAPETFTKSVDKQFAEPGEILTYTVVINNPNDFAVNNVLMTDATPMGTTYADNLLVSLPYTGIDPATGITITTIPANGSVTISWQVQVMDNIMINTVYILIWK